MKVDRGDIPVDDYRLIDFPIIRDEYMKFGLSAAWDALSIEKQQEYLLVLFMEAVEHTEKIQQLLGEK